MNWKTLLDLVLWKPNKNNEIKTKYREKKYICSKTFPIISLKKFLLFSIQILNWKIIVVIMICYHFDVAMQLNFFSAINCNLFHKLSQMQQHK